MKKREPKPVPEVGEPRTSGWRDVFLSAYKTCGIISIACKQAGISREAVRKARSRSAKFDVACIDALQEFREFLEAMGLERAKKSSDRLLEFFLKALWPDKYREKTEVEHTGQIRLELTDEQLNERIIRRLQRDGAIGSNGAIAPGSLERSGRLRGGSAEGPPLAEANGDPRSPNPPPA
jgi:hypothetical protein